MALILNLSIILSIDNVEPSSGPSSKVRHKTFSVVFILKQAKGKK
jgi:hypothetical protein